MPTYVIVYGQEAKAMHKMDMLRSVAVHQTKHHRQSENVVGYKWHDLLVAIAADHAFIGTIRDVETMLKNWELDHKSIEMRPYDLEGFAANPPQLKGKHRSRQRTN